MRTCRLVVYGSCKARIENSSWQLIHHVVEAKESSVDGERPACEFKVARAAREPVLTHAGPSAPVPSRARQATKRNYLFYLISTLRRVPACRKPLCAEKKSLNLYYN